MAKPMRLTFFGFGAGEEDIAFLQLVTAKDNKDNKDCKDQGTWCRRP